MVRIRRMNKQSPRYSRFGIIHHYNSPNSAVTVDGKEVHREEKILYIEYDENDLPISTRFIVCAPYSDHFVYLDPMWTKIKGRCSLMCTCGSMGIIVGYNAYKKDASPSSDGSMKGEMIVCKWHLDNGVHQTGGRSWQ
jgi:hypothetical protein